MDIKSKWKVLESREIFKTGLFRMRSDRCELPDGRIMPNYYICSFTDWVHILPITPEGKVILVEQYRHATGEVSLEIPGGALDPRIKEDAAQAGLRELREETGYDSHRVEFVCRHRPNPALQDNFLLTYVAFDCKKVGEQKLDPFEDIEVVETNLSAVEGLILSGRINHALVAASLFQCLCFLRNRYPDLITR